MPIVRISQAIRELEVGDQLRVEATDPAFEADVRAWAHRLGHSLESFEDNDGVFCATIRKQPQRA